MSRNILIKLVVVLLLTIIFALIDIPGAFQKIGISKEPKIKKGLDLVGGTHLAFQADMSKINADDRDRAISSLKDNIDKRVDALGVSEPLVQSRKIGSEYGLIVELPGIKDVNEAVKVIGKVANLQFKEQVSTDSLGKGTYTGEDLQKLQKGGGAWGNTELSGRHLKKAEVQFEQQSGEPQIAIEFNAEGTKIFSDLTKKNLQKPLAIFLDNELISAPTVQSEIKDGKAVITGKFTIDEAKKFALQLNAGSLPVPIKIIEQRNIGATLGEDSVKNGLMAGIIAAIVVILFMIMYYKLSGFLAVLALGVYTILVLGIFKLSSFMPWPMTITLPGIAGFVLSIGMAVDANILIFERTKEELRLGKPLITAIEEGFQRDWLSIRDSNLSTIITCLILFTLGIGSIKGFALTLGIGTLVSMFTAITVTRTFLQVVFSTRLKEKLNWIL